MKEASIPILRIEMCYRNSGAHFQLSPNVLEALISSSCREMEREQKKMSCHHRAVKRLSLPCAFTFNKLFAVFWPKSCRMLFASYSFPFHMQSIKPQTAQLPGNVYSLYLFRSFFLAQQGRITCLKLRQMLFYWILYFFFWDKRMGSRSGLKVAFPLRVHKNQTAAFV